MAFAVIDLVTTGFSPARGDRIVEVGVVLVDDRGAVEQEWATLVNPQRDVGATHVHGIRVSDVADAPLFGDVAAHLVTLLSGRTLVVHNQEFELRFLKAELAAHGFVMPATFAGLCTMLWSRSAFGSSKLVDVCAVLEIERPTTHDALGDARATAAILAALIRTSGRTPQWETDAAKAVFPLSTDASTTAGSATARETTRIPAAEADPAGSVDTAELPLWERVSIPVDPADAASAVYLDMLTRVLEDGLISTSEYSRLDEIAEVTALSKTRIVMLHASYLAAAYLEVLADGVVTDDERRELAQIATILDLPVPEIAETDGPAHTESPTETSPADPGRTETGPTDPAASATKPTFTLVPGARVVFTGAMSRPREAWASALADAGFITGSVTKTSAVLVAEDPASPSGTVKTARAHGIPVVTEAEFIPVFEAFLAQQSRG